MIEHSRRHAPTFIAVVQVLSTALGPLSECSTTAESEKRGQSSKRTSGAMSREGPPGGLLDMEACPADEVGTAQGATKA